MEIMIHDTLQVVNVFIRSNVWVKNSKKFYIVIYTFRRFKKKQERSNRNAKGLQEEKQGKETKKKNDFVLFQTRINTL